MPTLDIIIPAFNVEHCLDQTLEAIFKQTLPPELTLGVIVVNNRSSDSTGEIISRWSDRGVRRVDFADSQGRSSACNAGVAASAADYVMILDADCRLVGTDCLRVAAQLISDGAGGGFGQQSAESGDFWGRYLRALEYDRVAEGWQGWTTAVCLIKRDLYQAAGGMPTEYEHYGFEDRDFICRLRESKESGTLRSLPELQAAHEDKLSVQSVCEKMYISGRYSSGIFKRNFPKEYMAMQYSRVDVATARRFMVTLLKVLQAFQPALVRVADFLTRWRHFPIVIARPPIKLCFALSYFKGTVDRTSAT